MEWVFHGIGGFIFLWLLRLASLAGKGLILSV